MAFGPPAPAEDDELEVLMSAAPSAPPSDEEGEGAAPKDQDAQLAELKSLVDRISAIAAQLG